jgi:glycosyltransferase involved in cell wall biosynthesis
MKRKLVILTHRFPYFYSEPFLESEIIILSKAFDEILIIPSEINNFKRQVPKNVYVETSFSGFYKRKMIRSLMTLFSIYFWRQFMKSRKIKDFFHLFVFSSRVISYSKYIDKNKKLFSNCLVYSYWLNEAPVAFLDAQRNLVLNTVLVSRAHRYDLYEKGVEHVPYWPMRQELLNHIDKVFVISENGKEFLDNKYHCPQKTMVAKLGVFDNNVLSVPSGKGEFHIISVSRIDQVKRVLFILKTVEAFSSKFKQLEISWTHFGEGPLYPELLKESYKLENTNLKVDLKGSVTNSAIYDFYKNTPIDCFINLSLSEGIPVSIMEAQSFGIPVIATNVGGTSEIVKLQTGILLNPDVIVEQVVVAFENIIDIKFDRNIIKEIWRQNFDANINYSFFVGELQSLYDKKHFGRS